MYLFNTTKESRQWQCRVPKTKSVYALSILGYCKHWTWWQMDYPLLQTTHAFIWHERLTHSPREIVSLQGHHVPRDKAAHCCSHVALVGGNDVDLISRTVGKYHVVINDCARRARGKQLPALQRRGEVVAGFIEWHYLSRKPKLVAGADETDAP